MAAIYENAFITVIAVDGESAGHGLRGIGVSSQMRQYRPRKFNFSQDLCLLSGSSDEEEGSYLHKWHMRAWTFQERAISRRKLIFVNGAVCWECRHARISKTGTMASNLMGRWPHYMVGRATFPDLWTYFNLVAGYNHRHLTYSSDAQKAFSAVLDVMSSGFPGGFLFGIPEFCFDIGLLWTSSEKWPLTRRTMFLSWSWMGWAGPVELLWDFRQAAWDVEWREVKCRVVHSPVWVEPTTSWKKVARDGEHTRISNDYSYYQDYTQQSRGYYRKPGLHLPATSEPLPAGWTYEDRGT